MTHGDAFDEESSAGEAIRAGCSFADFRAKAELVLGVVKGRLRYRKTRYRGLQKQTAKRNRMFALANLIESVLPVDADCRAALPFLSKGVQSYETFID